MPSKSNKVNTSQKRSKHQRKNNHSFLFSHNKDTARNQENTFSGKPTVSNLIRWASKTLKAHGIDSPRLDAEVILSHLLNCKRIELYIHPDKLLEDATAESYKKAIQKRTRRVPLQYITNHAEFMSMDFYVDERVLIPRPETELLVEAVIKRSQIYSKEPEILIVDIGVGSGNIAITLAKKIINSKIFAIDISPDALSVAKINAQRHQVLEKITFLCGDTFKPLSGLKLETEIHFIVSNPPYLASDEFVTLQEEVRMFEPYTALVSDQDGLYMFKHIITNTHTWLKPGGFIVLEVGESQAPKVAKLLEGTKYFKKIEFIKDYQYINRIVVAQTEETRG